MTCHAGPDHSPDATDHGAFGWLCSDCWTWVQGFLERGKR